MPVPVVVVMVGVEVVTARAEEVPGRMVALGAELADAAVGRTGGISPASPMIEAHQKAEEGKMGPTNAREEDAPQS